MKKLLAGIAFLCFQSTYAQTVQPLDNAFFSPVNKTGLPQNLVDDFDLLMQHAQQNNPNFRTDISQLNASINKKAQGLIRTANKTTSANTVAVIFHIVLSQSQIQQVGGITEIENRINDQIDVLNADYNAANADSVKIPTAFKPFYGSVGIRFALAHKDPKANYTPGYEFINTASQGFNLQGGTGSANACSDVKFNATGGADAWDPHIYLNVWVTNILPAGIGGVGTPPPYPAYGDTVAFPWNEQGIVINYVALGRKNNSSQFFPVPNAVAGRTLVHEAGHFFNLFHPFGISTLDNVTCTDDDGVTDTPPQRTPSLNICGPYPITDNCSPTAPGVMFMNHMDYAPDTCRHLFTQGQAARINVELVPGGYRHSLLEHPEVIYYWPADVTNVTSNIPFSLFPNPAKDICYVTFDANNIPNGELQIINSLGQIVQRIIANTQTIEINLHDLQSGSYALKYISQNTVFSKRLIVE